MDIKVKEALEGSIRHWEENLENAKRGMLERVSLSANDCSLCELFFQVDCRGCPVSNETLKKKCGGTPYYAVENALKAMRFETLETIKKNDLIITLHYKMQAEMDFLKGLKEKLYD